jgi:hypothetical protein
MIFWVGIRLISRAPDHLISLGSSDILRRLNIPRADVQGLDSLMALSDRLGRPETAIVGGRKSVWDAHEALERFWKCAVVKEFPYNSALLDGHCWAAITAFAMTRV